MPLGLSYAKTHPAARNGGFTDSFSVVTQSLECSIMSKHRCMMWAVVGGRRWLHDSCYNSCR